MSSIDINACQKYSHCAMAAQTKAVFVREQSNKSKPALSKTIRVMAAPSKIMSPENHKPGHLSLSSQPTGEPKFFGSFVDDRSISPFGQFQILVIRLMVSLLILLQIGQETPGIGVNASTAEFIIARNGISLCIGGIALHS